MIKSLNHINLAVANIEISFTVYKDILGFTPICKSEGSAYLLLGSIDDPNAMWLSLDYDREAKRSPSPCNTHIAFTISSDELSILKRKLLDYGVASFKDNTSPGESFYFLDPDQHKLEIHAGDWRQRVQAKKSNLGHWKNIEWFV